MDMHTNHSRSRVHSLEDDDNISRFSYGFPNSLNSADISDSECGSGPISVRDMIQHYNNQFKKEESNHINHKIKYKINSARRYHQSQPPSQHLLAATRSSYCGLNNYGSQLNTSLVTDDQLQNKSMFDKANHSAAITCCKKCTACLCCQNRSRINLSTNPQTLSSTSSTSLLRVKNNENDTKTKSNFSFHSNSGNGANVVTGADGYNRRSSSDCNSNKINAKDSSILVTENGDDDNDSNINKISNEADRTVINPTTNKSGLIHNTPAAVGKQKTHLLLSDSVEEATNICQQESTPPTIETSYQSKTTIAKTSSGVRIIIDIFFNQEQYITNASDIVGSRVETDIPQSRILSEFQQQTLAASNSHHSNSDLADTFLVNCNSYEGV